VTDPLAAFTTLCLHASHARAAGGLLGMAALGLAGSAVHCAPMCGPLVLGQSLHRLSCLSCGVMAERHRLQAALLARYHAGRLLTYALLGAIAGGAGFTLQASIAPLRTALLLAAAAAMGVTAYRASRPGQVSRLPVLLQRLGLAPGSFRFGVVMGLLPCGLLYTALLAACASGTPWTGAAFMACFGLATLPSLALIGVAGHALPARGLLLRAAPVVLAFNAVVLLLAAGAGVLV